MQDESQDDVDNSLGGEQPAEIIKLPAIAAQEADASMADWKRRKAENWTPEEQKKLDEYLADLDKYYSNSRKNREKDRAVRTFKARLIIERSESVTITENKGLEQFSKVQQSATTITVDVKELLKKVEDQEKQLAEIKKQNILLHYGDWEKLKRQFGKGFSKALSIYLFVYRHGLRQKSVSVYCNIAYISKGLEIDRHIVSTFIKELIKHKWLHRKTIKIKTGKIKKFLTVKGLLTSGTNILFKGENNSG